MSNGLVGICMCPEIAKVTSQARIQADRQMDSFGLHPHEEEIWQVVDQHTQSLRQTGEQDLLTECRAHARLGQVLTST